MSGYGCESLMALNSSYTRACHGELSRSSCFFVCANMMKLEENIFFFERRKTRVLTDGIAKGSDGSGRF